MDYDNDEPVKVIIRIRPEELDDGTQSSDKASLSPLAKINNIRGHTNNNSFDTAPISKSVKFITQLSDQTIRLNAPYSDSGATGVFRKGVPAIDDKEFSFDKVYPESSKQEDIYAGVSNLVSATIRGYNATIFAYGCTGSGKSFTMTGTQHAPGIIPRVISDIFTSIEEKAKVESDIIFYIRISYVELYQNNFRNLLDFKKSTSSKSSSAFGGSGRGDDDSVASSVDEDSLQDTLKGTSVASSRSAKIEVRENTTAGVFLAGPNLRIPVTSAKEAFQLIAKGNKIRAVGATQCNEMSSRSHVILTIHVESKLPNSGLDTPKTSNLNSSFFADSVSENFDPSSSLDTQKASEREFGPEWRLGKIHLVDLAGSERLSMSGAEGETLLETQKINLALSALGDVLHALSKNSSIQMQHDKGGGYMMKNVNGFQVRSQKPLVPVPYRNSKLTHLLKDSLGGNSKTVMITTVRNNSDYYQQTLVSLSYSQRAKMVKNKSLINKSIGGDSGINAVAGEIERLKQRLEERAIEFDRLRDLQLEESNENLTLKLKFEELQRANNLEKKELEAQMSHVIHSQAGQLASQKQKILSLQSKLQNELSNAQNQIAEQEREINWLKKELDESTKSAQKPQEQLQKMQTLLDSWQSQVESMQSELSNAVKTNTSLRAKVSTLSNDLSAAESSKKELQQELNNRNNEVNDLTLVMTQKERYCDSLEKENQSLSSNIKAFEIEKHELQTKYKSLESIYNSLESRSSDNESKIKDLTRKNREIDKEKEDLKDKLTNMIGVLEKKSSTVINEASIKIQDTETKLRNAISDLASSSTEIIKLKAQLKESASSIEEMQSQIEIEKQSNFTLRNYNEKLVDLLKAKDAEVVSLTKGQIEKETQIREELAETCIQEMSKLKAEFSLREERHKQDWIERERQLKDEVTEFKNITSEVDTLKKKYEASLKSVTAEGEKKLHEANAKAEQVLAARVNELKEIFSTNYKKLQEDTETKVSDAVKAEKFTAAKKLETKVAEVTDKLKKEHHTAQTSLENAFRLEIAGMKSMHASELATAVELARSEDANVLNAEIMKLNSIWEGKVSQIVTESNEKILNLETTILQVKDQGQNDLKSSLDALKLKFEAKYKQKLDVLKSQESELETKYKNMISETEEKLKSELEGALRTQREKLALHHNTELESLKKMQSSELKLLESKHESELRSKDKEIQSLKAKHESSIQEVDSNWKIQMDSAKEALELELHSQFETRLNEVIQATQSEAASKLAQETTLLTGKLNAAIAEKLEMSEKLSEIQEQHRKEKMQASRQNYEEMENLERKYLNELKSQKSNLEDNHEKHCAELQSEIARLKLEYSELKNSIAMRQSLESKAQKEQREEFDKLLATTLSDRDGSNKKVLQSLKNQHEEEIERFKASIESLKERYESEIESMTKFADLQRNNIAVLNSQFEDEKSRMREEAQQKLSELSNLHKKELHDLNIEKEAIETKIDEIIKESKDQNRELNMSISKIRSQLESEKYQVAEEAKLELSAVEGKHRASLAMLEMKQQDEIDSIHASYKLKLKSRQTEFEAELERQDLLHKKNLIALQDEEKNTLQRIQEDHKHEVESINSANEKAINSLKILHASELKAKVDELEMKFSAKKTELLEDHKHEVQVFETEVRNLQIQIQELSKKLSESKREELQLSDSQQTLETNISRLLCEIETLKDSNKLEIETIKDRFQFEKTAIIEKLNAEHNTSRESLLQESLSKLELQRQHNAFELESLRRELSEQSERKQQASADEIKRLMAKHESIIEDLQSKHSHEIEIIRIEAKSKYEDKLIAERIRFENERNSSLEQQRAQLSNEHSKTLRDKANELESELAAARKIQAEHRLEIETLTRDGSHSRQVIENLNSKITDLKIELDNVKKVNAAEIEIFKSKQTKLLEEKQKELQGKYDDLANVRETMAQEDERARSSINALRDELSIIKLKYENLEMERLHLVESIASKDLDHKNFIETAKKLELVAKENMRKEMAEHIEALSQKYEKQLLDTQTSMQAKIDATSLLQLASSEKFDALKIEYNSLAAKLEAALQDNEKAEIKFSQTLAEKEAAFSDEMRKALADQQSMQGGYFNLMQGQVDSILNMIKLQSQNLPQVEEMQHKFLVMLEDLPEVWREKHGIKKEVLTNLKASDNFDESKSNSMGSKKVRTPIYLLAGSQVDKEKDREKEYANQAAAQAKLRAFSQINSSINNPGSISRSGQSIPFSSSSFGSSMTSSSSTSAHWQAAPVSPGQMCPHSDQLISAILDGDVQGIRAVIRSKGDNLNAEYWRDLSKSLLPLHRAISGLHFHGNERLLVATIECLCQLGSDINAADQSGNTVLHKAIQICTSKSVAAVVRCLIQRGADPMKRNKDNEIALHSECKRVRVASVEVVEILLNAQTDPNSLVGGTSALTIVLFRGATASVAASGTALNIGLKPDLDASSSNATSSEDNSSHENEEKSRVSGRRVWVKTADLLVHSNAKWDKDWRSESGLSQLHILVAAFPPYKDDATIYLSLLSSAIESGLSPLSEDMKGRNVIFILCIQMASTSLELFPNPAKVLRLLLDACPGGISNGVSDRSGHTIYDIEDTVTPSCLSSCRHLLISSPGRQVKSNNQSQSISNNGYNSRSLGQSDKSLRGFPNFSGNSTIDYKERSLSSNGRRYGTDIDDSVGHGSGKGSSLFESSSSSTFAPASSETNSMKRSSTKKMFI